MKFNNLDVVKERENSAQTTAIAGDCGQTQAGIPWGEPSEA